MIDAVAMASGNHADPIHTLTYEFDIRATTANPTPDFDFSGVYSYDRRNRIQSWTNRGIPSSFAYDNLGNLIVKGAVGQSYSESGIAGGMIRPHAVKKRLLKTYEYDASGNIAKITSAAGTPAETSNLYQFDSAGRLICITQTISCDVLKVDYDADGERLREVAGGVTRLFAGDDFEFLPGSTVSYVQVSALGERIARTKVEGGVLRVVEAWPSGFQPPPWLWAVPALAMAVFLAWYGARVAALVITLGRRPGYTTLVLVVSLSIALPHPSRACGGVGGGGGGAAATVTYNWILSDQIGSGLVELDANGAAIRQVVFEPFGQVFAEKNASVNDGAANDYFAGHPEQSQSGFYQMNARWMNPETGTFLSLDPLIADYTDPQSYNAYSYARNNPVSLIDPTGMTGINPADTIGPMCGGGAGLCGGALADSLNQGIGQAAAQAMNPFASLNLSFNSAPASVGGMSVGGFGFQGLPNVSVLSGGFSAAPPVSAPPPTSPGSTFVSIAETAFRWTVYDYKEPLGDSHFFEAATLLPLGKIAKGPKLAEKGISVLGHFPDYLKRSEELGARRFSVPEHVWDRMSDAERWTANQKFLDRAIARGDIFELATPLDRVRPGSYLDREIQHLLDRGYGLEGARLLPP